MRSLLRLLGSFHVAISLMTILAILLGVTTFIELDFGTPVARFLVYQTEWFHLLLGFLGLNLLAAVLLRFPWKKRHIPFLIAHCGILILLLGCVRSIWFGQQARMTISEGSEQTVAILPSDRLFRIEISDSKTPLEIPFSGGPFNGADYSWRGWNKNGLMGEKKALWGGPSLFRSGVWLLAQLRRPQVPRVLYDQDSVKLELLEYFVASDFFPVRPLQLEWTGKNPDKPTSSSPISLAFPERGDTVEPGSLSKRGLRKTLPDGRRLVFSLARSERELDRFLKQLPQLKSESLSEIVLEYREELYTFPLSQLGAGKELPLGKSGLKIVDSYLHPTLMSEVTTLKGRSILLALQNEKGEREEMILHSELTERSTFAERLGVSGTFWDQRNKKEDKPVYGRDWDPNLDQPRLELIQDPAGRLAWRFWNGQTQVRAGLIPLSPLKDDPLCFESERITMMKDSLLQELQIQQFQKNDEPGYYLSITPFRKEMADEFYAKARLRLTMNGTTETFLIRPIPPEGLTKKQALELGRKIESNGRQATLRWVTRTLSLGFSLYLNYFRPAYEPGSSTPASFESSVNYHPLDSPSGKLDRNGIRIAMNRPAFFKDPKLGKFWKTYQDSFRGPFYPGENEFDAIVKGSLLKNEQHPRTKIYHTILSLNNDPGRTLKYLGSIMIVLGSALLIGRWPKKRNKKTATVAVLLLTLLFGMDQAGFAQDDPEQVKSWRALPVFHDGRIMPLNTFALITVKEICGSTRPWLAPNEDLLRELESNEPFLLLPLSEYLPKRTIRAEEKKKIETWYNKIREETIDRQQKGARRVREIFAKGPRRFDASELVRFWITEPEVWSFIPFLYDPQGTVSSVIKENKSGTRTTQFWAPCQLDRSIEYQREIERLLRREGRTYTSLADIKKADRIDAALAALERRSSLFHAISFDPNQRTSPLVRLYLEQILYPAPVISILKTGDSLIEQLDRSVRRLQGIIERLPDPIKDSPFNDEKFLLNQTTKITNDGDQTILALARQLNLLSSIYEESPLTMNTRLFSRLDRELRQTQHQLHEHFSTVFTKTIGTVEYRETLARISVLFDELVHRFERATLALFETGTYRIQKLSTQDRLQESSDAETMGPRKILPSVTLSLSTDGSLKAVPLLVSSLGKLDEEQDPPWGSLQFFLYAPEALRNRLIVPDQNITVTGSWTPVQLADALRRSGQASQSYRHALLTERMEDPARGAHFFTRIDYPKPGALEPELFYYQLDPFYWTWCFALLALPFFFFSIGVGLSNRRQAEQVSFWIGLLFLLASSAVTLLGGSVRSWITGWAPVTNMYETVVLLAFLLSVLSIGCFFMPIADPEGVGFWRRRIETRRLFVLLGTIAVFAVGYLAWSNTTEFNPNIRPLVAVLRSNFWLTIHVVAIILSYALGTIAWLIALVMLSAYLFGHYAKNKKRPENGRYQEPKLVERLAPYLLALLRAAVVFLTLGTILGAFWADFSWGRFWSWDPKEVWALVTLLIYLVILHGRIGGFYGRFGLVVGAIGGAFAIIMTWYGLSFVFGGGGRHAYTAGESGRTTLLYVLLWGNVVWTILAALRYQWKRG